MDLRSRFAFSFSYDSLSLKMGYITNIKIGDLNGDGLVDVFVGSDSFTEKSPGYLLTGQTGGTFEVAARLPARYTPREAVFGDFNGDGIDDVFVANTGPDTSPAPGEPDSLLLSDGDGYAGHKVPGGSNAFSHGAAIADIDRDGDLDIFVATNGNDSNAQPYFLVNDGRGDFALERNLLPKSVAKQNRDTSDVRYQVADLWDVNGDGWDDLILGKQEEPGQKSRISKVFLSDHGRFDDKHAIELRDHPKLKHAQEVIDIRSMDLDANGTDEVIVLSQGRRKSGYTSEWAIQVFEDTKSKGLVDHSSKFLGDASYSNGSLIPYFLEFADINQDGLVDIIPYMPGGGSASLKTPAFYLNTGDGRMELFTIKDIIPDESQAFLFQSGTVPVFHGGKIDFIFLSSDGKGHVDVSALQMTEPLPTYGDGDGLPGLLGTQGKIAIDGSGESQTLQGGGKGELIRGFGGVDTLIGKGGHDDLLGGKGNDRLSGGMGNDVLAPDKGRDTLTGGKGSDVFVFARGDGKDTVTDFHPTGAKGDLLDLSGLPEIRNFRDLKANHMEQHGADIWIDGKRDTIILEHLKPRDLDASDFIF